MDHTRLEAIFTKYDMTDFKWIDPKQIVTAQWVRLKCMFGCKNYGKHASCPPNVPSVSECGRVFHEYGHGVIFHFAVALEKPEDRDFWTRETNQTLLLIEREVFLQGHERVFILPMSPCSLCDECAGAREACKSPRLGRPTPESMAVDVFSTVRKYGFPIHVLTDVKETTNLYALLLVE